MRFLLTNAEIYVTLLKALSKYKSKSLKIVKPISIPGTYSPLLTSARGGDCNHIKFERDVVLQAPDAFVETKTRHF